MSKIISKGMKIHNSKYASMIKVTTCAEQMKLLIGKRGHFLNFEIIKVFFS